MSSSRRYCCIKSCTNTPYRLPRVYPPIKFYSFPGNSIFTPWKLEKRNKWINAVRNYVVNSCKDWEPTIHTKICSAHFINNTKSEHPSDPSYLPTIFSGKKKDLSERDKRRFPFKNSDLLQKWIKAIRRENWAPSKSSRICSSHFLESDYLLRPGAPYRRLKPSAVPSVFNFSIPLKQKPTERKLLARDQAIDEKKTISDSVSLAEGVDIKQELDIIEHDVWTNESVDAITDKEIKKEVEEDKLIKEEDEEDPLKIETPKFVSCGETTYKDEDRRFLLTLLPFFRTLTEEEKIEAKMEFLKVLRRFSKSNEENQNLLLGSDEYILPDYTSPQSDL